MGYRDESEALRARIVDLEEKLQEAEDRNAGKAVESSVLSSKSVFQKKVLRFSQSVEGELSDEGVEAIRVALWNKLGAAEEGDEDKGVPGETLLVHKGGHQCVRVRRSGGDTHLTVDHRKWGFARSVLALVLFAAALCLGMLVSGVHDDWNQMIMGAVAVATVVLGPLAILNGWSRESASEDLLKSLVRIATESIAEEPRRPRARVGKDVAVVRGRQYEPLVDETEAPDQTSRVASTPK